MAVRSTRRRGRVKLLVNWTGVGQPRSGQHPRM